jgi:toxin ParE1/3/4
MKIVISAKARRELLQVYSYVAERSPQAADSLVAEFDRRFQNLSAFPFIGRERPQLSPGIRSVVVETYVVFYTVQSDRIVIYRVIDGRMDIDEEFRR